MKKITTLLFVSLSSIIFFNKDAYCIRPSTAALSDTNPRLEYQGQTGADEIRYFIQQRRDYEKALEDWKKEKARIEKDFYAEKDRIRRQEERDSRNLFAKSDRRTSYGRSSGLNWDVKSWFTREPSNAPDVSARARYSEKLDPQKILSSSAEPPIKKKKTSFWGHIKKALGLS